MPRTVTISDENFRKIQDLAEPLVDSVDSVLSRVLESYSPIPVHIARARSTASSQGAEEGVHGVVHLFEPFNPPDLRHTKVTLAYVAGTALNAPNWNSILDQLVLVAADELKDFSSLKKVVRANLVQGEKTNEGYHYLINLGLSLQGQSANDAWRYCAHIARELNLNLRVEFVWRDKEGAFRPGQRGRFLIQGGT